MRVSGDELSSTFVYDALFALADTIEPHFPHHAKCIRDEMLVWRLVDGTWSSTARNMTDSRWNRLADIVCSMAAMPGRFLPIEARHIRLSALCLAESARAMARHRFGGKRAFGALELAVHIATPEVPSLEEDPAPSTP